MKAPIGTTRFAVTILVLAAAGLIASSLLYSSSPSEMTTEELKIIESAYSFVPVEFTSTSRSTSVDVTACKMEIVTEIQTDCALGNPVKSSKMFLSLYDVEKFINVVGKQQTYIRPMYTEQAESHRTAIAKIARIRPEPSKEPDQRSIRALEYIQRNNIRSYSATLHCDGRVSYGLPQFQVALEQDKAVPLIEALSNLKSLCESENKQQL